MTQQTHDPDIETLHRGDFLALKKRGHWEYAERTNASAAVIVVAVTPENKLILVEQFRIPIQKRTIEMPAGLIGDIGAHDTAIDAAKRELLEETGWQAEHIDYLMEGPSSSGLSTEQMVFVRARGLTKVGAGGGDETEDIIVHEIDRKNVGAFLCERMADGYSIDPKLYAGLYFIDFNPDGSEAEG